MHGPSGSAIDHGSLSLQGGIWTIEFNGVVRHVKTFKGFTYLTRLLAEPGTEIAATDLEIRAEKDSASGEKARLNVTRAIQSTIARVGDAHPELAEHLRATVRTGRLCSYRPDPRVPIRWRIEQE